MSGSGGVASRMAAQNAPPSWGLHTLRRVAPRFAGWWAAALIALGALIRLGLLLLDWPTTDSDEATMGLMALHINTRGEWPLFFYGQSYMGTIQAYLGALLFHLFGVSVLSLRLGLLLLFILFLATMYALLRLTYGRAFALFGLLLLDLGGPDLLKPQLLALGGYPETLLFGALSLLLAAWLALAAPLDATARHGWRRLAPFAALGLAMGLGWWSDPLVTPFLVASALLVALFRRHDTGWRGGAALGLGLGLGLLPQIVYTIAHTAATGPTAVAAFQPQGVSTLVELPARFVAQALGMLVIALPNITGVGWLCAAPTTSVGALASVTTGGALACVGLRAGWSVGLLALGVVAARVTWRSLRDAPSLRQVGAWSQAERGAAVRLYTRLALLLGGALTLAFYLISPAAATPAGNARYLIGLTIALPAIIAPLWSGSRAPTPPRVWLRLACAACLGLLVVTLAAGVAATYAGGSAARASFVADQRLTRDLERLGVRHMYTDYWTCYKVAFLSHERITCDTLNATLGQGNNRYPPYVAAVEADPNAAYVFASGPQAQALARKAHDSAWPFRAMYLDGYVVYLRQ